jgi:hypothetical protein
MVASRFFTILVVGVAACGTEGPTATGELEPWTATAALPTPRANHCMAVIDDHLFVIGGNHADGAGGFVKTDEIHMATLVYGVVTDWTLAGHTPSPVTECSATASGSSLYVLGGIYDDDAHRGNVWTATFDGNALSSMTALTSIPSDAATSMEAAVRDGQLLVSETRIPQSGDMTRTLVLDLATTTWTTRDWGIGFRAQSQVAFSGEFIYTIGGYHDPALGTVADVSFQSIADGSTRATLELPTQLGFGEAVAVDDWLFVVGGRAQVFGAPGTSTVFAGKLADSGDVTEWLPLAALPMARTNHELAVVGDYLVLTGGAVMGPGDDTVWTSRGRF